MDAMKDTPEGERQVTVQTNHDGNGHILVAVRDSGRGIESNDLRRIFDSFFTTKSEGMGMGLSICRSVLVAHGGTIQVEPVLPSGVSFQILLPKELGAPA